MSSIDTEPEAEPTQPVPTSEPQPAEPQPDAAEPGLEPEREPEPVGQLDALRAP